MQKFITLLSFVAIFFSCTDKRIKENEVKGIGQALIHLDSTSINSSIREVVFVGGGLLREISQLRAKAKTYEFSVKPGDFDKPYGNNSADCILTIATDYKDIGIRLKYNDSLKKYDILGWMTLRNKGK